MKFPISFNNGAKSGDLMGSESIKNKTFFRSNKYVILIL
ncbi:hypothetical protein N198_05510 [Helicobacter pylori UM037]|uniref:Uncharacterized protein n=1 Tax=Helicobacter pylori UM037 TaxID=1321939 RepID=A0AB33Z8S1_HELPX|nr:hypothetical protein N198_05510 [Helicobacter pylori UM037]